MRISVMKRKGRQIVNFTGVVFTALLATVFTVNESRADETYLVHGRVYRNMIVCLAGVTDPCPSSPTGPIAGAKVTVRNETGRFVRQLKASRHGVFKTRLAPGLYTLSTGPARQGGSSLRIEVVDRRVIRIALFKFKPW